jgi:hypothetical protein
MELMENVFDGQNLMRFNQAGFYLARSKPLPAAEAEALLPRLLDWQDRQNLYSIGGDFLELTADWQPVPATRGRKSLAEWKQFLEGAESGSSQGRVRYEALGDLQRLSYMPGKVTPQDFRLQISSPGYRADKDGRDLGMDPHLVGPGPAYERWKQTAEYQRWLRDTGQ